MPRGSAIPNPFYDSIDDMPVPLNHPPFIHDLNCRVTDISFLTHSPHGMLAACDTTDGFILLLLDDVRAQCLTVWRGYVRWHKKEFDRGPLDPASFHDREDQMPVLEDKDGNRGDLDRRAQEPATTSMLARSPLKTTEAISYFTQAITQELLMARLTSLV